MKSRMNKKYAVRFFEKKKKIDFKDKVFTLG